MNCTRIEDTPPIIEWIVLLVLVFWLSWLFVPGWIGGNMNIESTPIPWRVERNGPAFNLYSGDSIEPFMILLGMEYQKEGEHEANVQQIVQRVNGM